MPREYSYSYVLTKQDIYHGASNDMVLQITYNLRGTLLTCFSLITFADQKAGVLELRTDPPTKTSCLAGTVTMERNLNNITLTIR